MDTLDNRLLVDGLVRIGETLASGASIHEQMTTMCRVVASILECDRSSIMIWDGQYYWGRYNYGNPPDIAAEFREYRARIYAPLISRVVKTGSYQVINDALNDPATEKIAHRARINAIVVAPIANPNGSPLAFMTAEFSERIGQFDRTRGDIVQGTARLAQIALLANQARISRIREIANRRELVGDLIRSEDAERSRLSREIHDDSIQRVLALHLKLSALCDQSTDPVTRKALEGLTQASALAADSLRDLLGNLHPRGLEDDGLARSLERALRRFAVGTGWRFEVESKLAIEPTTEIETVLYRSALQAFTSIEIHASATWVLVQLQGRDRGTEMVITNDGNGFDVSKLDPGTSQLFETIARVELMSGTVDIESGADTGTTMRIWIPSHGRLPTLPIQTGN